MIALRILDEKNFMKLLLNSTHFDSFSLEIATITTFNTFSIEGRIQPAFFGADEDSDDESESSVSNLPKFSLWKDMRPLCLDLIKGKRRPIGLLFVLHADKEYTHKLLHSASQKIDSDLTMSLILNIKYDSTGLTCVTGTACISFVMDKTPDELWDETVRTFFTSLGIAFEEL